MPAACGLFHFRSVAMPLNGFNTGRDYSLQMTLPNGKVSTINLIEASFDPVTKTEMIVPINGVPTHLIFPQGWKGTLQFDRNNSQLDDFYAAFEAAFYANGSTIPGGTIVESITEVDGSVSTYHYTGVQIVPNKMGTWKGDDKVSQSVDVVASQRVKVS
jgi:hypothetical protein